MSEWELRKCEHQASFKLLGGEISKEDRDSLMKRVRHSWEKHACLCLHTLVDPTMTVFLDGNCHLRLYFT